MPSSIAFLSRKFYKRLKNLEMKTFIKLDLQLNKNQTYIILPPLKFKSDNRISLIFDNYEKWASRLREELSYNNSIVYPRGIVGIITKILFLLSLENYENSFLDIYKKSNFRISKDTAGGYGTENNLGDSLFVKALSYFIKKTIFWPNYHLFNLCRNLNLEILM